jgi:phosphonate metabolism protein PhnN/1,5-bisphosphokinase (PRPP-forming)
MTMLVLVVGPSGAGKDTLLDAVRPLLEPDGRVRFARRDITRPVTPGGEAHHPIDRATFEATRNAGGYALWWEAHDLAYGIPADIEADLAAGRVVVASVSRAVIADAVLRYPLRVVEITAPPGVLAARLSARAREDEADIARRLQRQMPLPPGIEVVTVVNDATIEEGAARLLAAITPSPGSASPSR